MLITSSAKASCLCTDTAVIRRDAARRINAVTVHKQDAFADEVINTELDKVLDRGKDITTALADAQRLLARRAHR